MKALWNLGVVLLGLAIAGDSRADEPEKPQAGKLAIKVVNVPAYWIGVHGEPLDEAWQTQLDLKLGVLVQHVAADSPAAKGGLKKFDVIVKFGAAEVGSLEAIAEQIERVKDKETTVEVVRGGKRVELKVTPEKRSELGLHAEDADAVQRWWMQAFPGQRFGNFPRMQFMRPGVIMPEDWQFGGGGFGGWFGGKLPKNSSVTVTKQGEEPAKISVRVDGKSYDVTEDNLKDLPPEVRSFVEPILRADRMREKVRGAIGEIPERIERARTEHRDSFEQLREDLERMRKEMEQLRKEVRGKKTET